MTVVDVVGADFEKFRHLARTHSDGWGAAWRTGDTVASRVSTEAADDSEAFRSFADTHLADAAIVHLRWATRGLAVCAPNTHPFTAGDVAFAHNGSVLPPDSLDALIPDHLAATRRGDTDSERIFLATRARMAGADQLAPADALVATLRAIDRDLEFTSLNCLLLTPDQLIAASLHRPHMVEEHAPFALTPDYYDMHFRVAQDAVVIGSSGWPQPGWHRLSNGEVLTVDRATLSVSVTELPARAADRAG